MTFCKGFYISDINLNINVKFEDAYYDIVNNVCSHVAAFLKMFRD